ncbi:MAG TPA: MlaD family protein [Solirubrobacteraceae bacterium]|jgi:ABC-type transporter Mla subunit MlaD|nr:MlaD family protein [Solirubrobacteraceae bacterium]
MNPRRRSSLAASPLLIGALTTLIAAVAVYISYNAANGLPFTPTYNIKVELPETSGLQKGNEVRLTGKRIGVVSGLTPHQDSATGRVTAIVSLKLEKHIAPLPADTTTLVQSVSTIGLKYLELTRGHARKGIPEGGTIPASQSHEPVQIQGFFNMFDKQTRVAIAQNTDTFGNGLAGRGLGLNNTIAMLRPLVHNAVPVLHNLASPQTGFGQLFVAFDKAATEVAPVAETQAALYDDLATFFTAFAGASPSLERTIEGGPAALRQAIHSLPSEAPFIEKTTEFMRLLRPSAHILSTVAEPLGHAFEVGAVNLRAAAALNPQLTSALQSFEVFSRNPVVTLGLEEFTRTAQLGNPLLAGITPAQTTCNYITLAFRNVANLLAESVSTGTLARVVPILSPSGPNNEGLPASAPANGPSLDKNGTSGAVIPDNFLHYNPYPNVAGPGQPKECEAGNAVYTPGKMVIGNTSTTLGTLHDVTKRSDGLFGETYPSSTLKYFPKEGSGKSTNSTSGKSTGKGKGA